MPIAKTVLEWSTSSHLHVSERFLRMFGEFRMSRDKAICRLLLRGIEFQHWLQIPSQEDILPLDLLIARLRVDSVPKMRYRITSAESFGPEQERCGRRNGRVGSQVWVGHLGSTPVSCASVWTRYQTHQNRCCGRTLQCYLELYVRDASRLRPPLCSPRRSDQSVYLRILGILHHCF